MSSLCSISFVGSGIFVFVFNSLEHETHKFPVPLRH